MLLYSSSYRNDISSHSFQLKDSIRQWDRRLHLQEELKTQEQELDSTLAKQREVGIQILFISLVLVHTGVLHGDLLEMRITPLDLDLICPQIWPF